ncbi:MAG: DNA recombination protein RmuC, partial [Bacteroidales bacterium]|nr:DNA recombination protein RmuC [Bacteroidales bacterium]
MPEIIIASLSLLLLLVILMMLLRHKNKDFDLNPLLSRLDFIEKNNQRFEQEINNEFRENRAELAANLKNFQEQFLETLREINRSQQEQMKNISETSRQSIFNLNQTLEEKLSLLTNKNEESSRMGRQELAQNLKVLNEEIQRKLSDLGKAQKEQNDAEVAQLEKSLRQFQEAFSQNVKAFNDLQREKFGDLEKKQAELITSTELKLEKMRETVDEKLQKTLETRLGKSFELVSKQLESVQKGLGEMQTLANDVGGLKRVLSNVKTRGVLGEIQLGNILEQILAPEQYETNVKTKRSSGDHVEFAIKLPGRDEDGGSVYLPIDAKFPQEAYHLLQTAYDEGNMAKVDEAVKILVRSIKTFAKDIRDKYLDPPYTTDFGIMFLPIEGLYAEV